MAVEWDLSSNLLDARLRVAFNQVAYELGNEFTRVITETRDWGAPFCDRDIVDTGRLRASQRVEIEELRATYTWPVDYALPVHEGFTTSSGRVIPGRPWSRVALEQFDPNTRFRELLNE